MKKDTTTKNKYLYRAICALILTLISTGAFFLAWHKFATLNNQTGHLLGLGNIGMAIIVYTILYYLIGRWLSAFSVGMDRKANLLSSQILTLASVDFIEIFVSCAITGEFRFFFVLFKLYGMLFVGVCIINCVVVLLMIRVYKTIFPPTRILEIYGKKNSLGYKFSNVAYKYTIEKSIHYEEQIENLEEEIQKYDAILINDVPEQKENEILKTCFKNDMKVYFAPRISDVLVKHTKEINLFDTPIFFNANDGIKTRQKIEKRAFDIVASGLALLILSPLFLVVALAIHFEDNGPVFYKQERETLGGKHFMIIKFRSMIVDAEKDGRPHPAGEKDDRITKVGRIIRACRIDELPQLINIFKGDMSVVGPRPERCEHCEIYRKNIPEWDLRNKVRGGLTGYAQVYGKYNTTALDKLKFDLIYITNYNFVLDLRIMFQTLKVLTQKESTEGFDEDKILEMHDAR